MILALPRGFVTHYYDFISLGALTAYAEGGGDGGGGGDAGGGGDVGGDGGGGGDAGDAGGGGGDAGDPAAPGGDIGGPGLPDPIFGCMDPTALNFNSAATSQSGVTCTYPVHGCMDPTATNYNSAATDQVGVTCTYPTPPVIGCMDPTATNYNSAATSQTGVTCTYPATPAVVVYGCMDLTATNYNSAATSQTGVTCTYPTAPIYGCMDSTATNFNSAATSQTGVTCTYPTAPIYGCMDSDATNYNSSATSQTGVTCTYPDDTSPPPTPIYGCMDSTATNYNSSATSQTGVTCTYPSSVTPPPTPIFGCMDSTATNYNSSATSQTGVTCTYPSSVTPPPPPPPTGGGGGGGVFMPTITLAALPHVSAQPLAYLYLSQIPYTGLDLGPIGMVLYWIALVSFALAISYLVLFGAAPVMNRRLHDFGLRVKTVLNARELTPATVSIAAPILQSATVSEPPRSYSSYDGFKSYARNGALSIEDIVKSLSQHHHEMVAEQRGAQAEPHVEPVYQHVEPIYEHVEAIMPDAVVETTEVPAPAHIRGFATALIEGDRAAVFAGLRQHVRGGGVSEHLLSKTVCLIDDVYRSRIDGSACDPDLARMTARFDTPTLEKLVSSLTTAIDSSYSTGVTGAKLALTRALAVLGA